MHVTDHAVLRYLERKYKLDIAAMKKEMAATAEPAMRAGALYSYVDGISYVFEGETIITVITGKPTLARRTRRG